MNANALLWLFIELVGIACLFGLALFIVRVLPIDEPFKTWLAVAVKVLAALLLMFWIVALISGGSLHPVFLRVR